MAENKITDNNENIGAIKISEEVIAILADKAIKEVDGIAGMSGSLVDSFVAVLGKKVSNKGIGVDIKDNNVVVSLHTIVKYGVRIPEVAWRAQEAVKSAVESMTGMDVVKVNISIEGVEFEKTADGKESELSKKDEISVQVEGEIIVDQKEEN